MPDLIIIAECNGAGKSTFASSFLPEGLTSFDYDRVFSENYNSLADSELREVIAKNQTAKDFESSVKRALLIIHTFATKLILIHIQFTGLKNSKKMGIR